jgi:membrane fusion protein (multidrug efflux system)
VSAEKAKTERWRPFVRAIGTVKAASGVDIAPQVGGVVEAIHFRSGDRVKEGEELVTLDSDTERADLKSLEATLRNAERELDRKGSLAKKGIGSQSDSDSARARRDETIAAIEKMKALIAKKTIYAPFSGELGLKHVELGQYVSPGMALVWLQTLDPVYVDFTIPQRDLTMVKSRQAVELTIGAYPNEVFKGTVETIDARMAADTRTLTVRAAFANGERKLVPGMFVNVAVVTGEPEEVVTVPETAITYSLYGDSVFVVVPVKTKAASAAGPESLAHEVERRFVGLGEARDGRIAITSGLKAGEEVATAGQLKLNPGTRVTINNDVVLDAGGVRKTE